MKREGKEEEKSRGESYAWARMNIALEGTAKAIAISGLGALAAVVW